MEEKLGIETQEWYKELVEDCRGIITQTKETGRWVLIEGYHELGKRIATENNLDRSTTYGKEIVNRCSQSLNISKRLIWHAINFYELYPIIDEFRKIENISWSKIRTNYLPSSGKNIDAPVKTDRAEELQIEWRVQPGQIWLLGKHRLVCGNSEDPVILGAALDGVQPMMIVTDPPYGMDLDTDYSKMPSTKPEGNKEYSKIIGDDKPFDYQQVILRCGEEFWFGADYYRKTILDGGSWLVWDKRVEEKFDNMIGSAFELIWSKNKHKREIIRHNNTLFSGEAEAKNKHHPTSKPTKVIEWIISKYSINGDIIADLYSGSGSTILACENLGRVCIAIEIDPKYVALTLERFKDATGIVPMMEARNAWD